MKCFKYLTGSIVIFVAITVSAQPDGYSDLKKLKVYARIYASYGFLTPGSFKGSSVLHNSEVRFQAPKSAMGNGIYYGAGVGVIINNFWNIGIAGEYLNGNKIYTEQNYSRQYTEPSNTSNFDVKANRTYNYSIASIVPNVVFKSFSTPSISVYTRMGLQIGFPLKMTESYFYDYRFRKEKGLDLHDIKSRDQITTITSKHVLKPGLGFQVSTGIQLVLSDKLRGFIEISANRISYNRDRHEVVESLTRRDDTNLGESPMPTVYDRSKSITYFINKGTTGTIVRGVPNNYLTINRRAQEPINVNSVNAGLGLAFVF